MTVMTRDTAIPRWQSWLGYLFSAAPALLMLLSAWMKVFHSAETVEQFVSHYGFAASALFGLGVLEAATVAIYLIPLTSILGAIFMTGYLGGAVVTEFRVGSPLFAIPALLGLLAWGGLFLRDVRLRVLIPFRRKES
jgi:hypothetical protein